MGKPITLEQDPMAVFLEFQLPQMIAQSKEAEKNRVHEKDILQERQKIEQENFLLETQTTRGLKDLDALTKDIEAQEKKLTDIDLIPSQWELLPPKDQSKYVKKLMSKIGKRVHSRYGRMGGGYLPADISGSLKDDSMKSRILGHRRRPWS